MAWVCFTIHPLANLRRTLYLCVFQRKVSIAVVYYHDCMRCQLSSVTFAFVRVTALSVFSCAARFTDIVSLGLLLQGFSGVLSGPVPLCCTGMQLKLCCRFGARDLQRSKRCSRPGASEQLGRQIVAVARCGASPRISFRKSGTAAATNPGARN